MFKLDKIGEWFQSPLLLLMRIYWGYSFFDTGKGKLMDISGIASYFQSLGIPFPTLNAYIAGSVECVGGLLLLVGLFSRWVSIPLAFTMIVAFATADRAALTNFLDDPYGLLKHIPFTYLLCALIIFAFGPGKYSLDYLWMKWKKKA